MNKHAKLHGLFAKLYEWPKPDAVGLAPFVVHCLDILSVITEDHNNVKSIATSLYLILKARPTAEQKLRGEFLDIEKSLENDLRGFSSLLDLVLEENTIRLNTCEMLDKLPAKFRAEAEQFNRLVRQIDALMDLEMAFDIGRPEVLSLLFLLALEEIMSLNFQLQGTDSRLLLLEWLKRHIPESVLGSILRADLDFDDSRSILSHCESEAPGLEAVIITFLCRASAGQMVIDADSYLLLDSAIAQVGLDGLMPLIESGFIRSEGLTAGENVAKVFYVV